MSTQRICFLFVLILSAAVAGVVYWAHGDVSLDKPRHVSPAALVHASALLALYFLSAVVRAASSH